VEDNPREAKGDHHESNEGEGREEDTPADPKLVEDEDERELNRKVDEIGRIGKIAEWFKSDGRVRRPRPFSGKQRVRTVGFYPL
jgi:hypothetical protein